MAFSEFGGEYEAVSLVKEPYEGTEWGRAVLDMAAAIEEGRPHRATGEQAAHVVEILNAIAKSSQVAIAKVALDLREDAVFDVLQRAGFGDYVSLGLPG